MDPYSAPDDRDVENPYAPPRSMYTSEPLPEITAGAPFSVQDVFNWTWAIFKERFGLCLSIFWGAQGLILAVSLGMKMLVEVAGTVVRDPVVFRLAFILVQFSGIVVQVWLGIGLSLAFLKIARGEPVAFDEVFRGGRFVLTIILAYIVFVLALAVPIGLATAVITAGFLVMENQLIACVLLFLVVSTVAGLFVVYVTARLIMYFYLIIDRNVGVIDSLRQSWALCRNALATITLVFFLQLAIGLAGLLACFVGLIVAAPLMSLLLPVTYVALTGTGSPQPARADAYWEDDA
jgi:hypothetical protein